MYDGDRVSVLESVSELIDSRSEYRCGEGAVPVPDQNIVGDTTVYRFGAGRRSILLSIGASAERGNRWELS